ncbi:DUF4118 domain-containing protein [Caballeronia sp. LZ016]|uniref:DUF4118 domain-containing protein n=1 Tax=Caballeronia sp. LZ016 TaxID=3038554 RepID=UPI002859CA08|nr:DUF4118 domain-containing protein [Caballeronia sp. LZ016]MDR5741064.1 DUF4118 domain-containing protein [Caballeronia sp. LZ016]
MRVNNSRRWAPRGVRRWMIAAAALVTAAVVRALLHPVLGPVMPGTAFLIAAVLVQYYCGLAPAVCVMLAGLCIADYLFVPPYGRIDFIDQSDIVLLVSYPLITALFITLVERLKRAQYRAKLLAAVAQSRYEMLLRHDNERLLAQRSTDEMHRLLHHIAQYNRSLILIKALDTTASVTQGGLVTASSPAVSDSPIDIGSFSAGVVYGPGHARIHREDLARVTDRLLPGRHRMRLRADGHDWRPAECICERFTTPPGDFLILRVEERA